MKSQKNQVFESHLISKTLKNFHELYRHRPPLVMCLKHKHSNACYLRVCEMKQLHLKLRREISLCYM